MNQEQIENLFHIAFKGAKNFMTDEIMEYGEGKDYIYELSKGLYCGNWIYGVTVLTVKGIRANELSKVFNSTDEARDHITKL